MVAKRRRPFKYKRLPSTVEKLIEVTNTASLRQELKRRHGDTVRLAGPFRPGKVAQFGCDQGHQWRALAEEVITGRGCPKCPRRKTNNRYKAHLKAERGTDIIALEDYINTDTKIMHECGFCGYQWKIRPKDVLDPRYHCPACKSGDRNKIGGSMPYSSMAVDWLEKEARRRRIRITHAGNGGEYTLPKTKFKVDGYCHEKRMVFEFHGDVWHGNPNLFDPDDYCHPHDKSVTAAELNVRTQERLRQLDQLGYTVIHIWEADWKEGKAAKVYGPLDPDSLHPHPR